MTPPATLLAELGITSPVLAAQTGIATIWKVQYDAGTPLALKVYNGLDERDEGPGLTLMQAWAGKGCAQITARTPGAVLMEWLDGPSLGDMARAGDDRTAAQHLAETAVRLHQTGAPSAGLTPLDQRCATLWDAGPGFAAQQVLARSLLATAPPPVALHGDLHHDNILKGPRSWCAIDPKGLWGDPAYEMANAFRNPVGADALWRDPDRIVALATCFNKTLDVPLNRLLGWAAVHVCLSILWDDAPPHDHPDHDLIDLFLHCYRAA